MYIINTCVPHSLSHLYVCVAKNAKEAKAQAKKEATLRKQKEKAAKKNKGSGGFEISAPRNFQHVAHNSIGGKQIGPAGGGGGGGGPPQSQGPASPRAMSPQQQQQPPGPPPSAGGGGFGAPPGTLSSCPRLCVCLFRFCANSVNIFNRSASWWWWFRCTAWPAVWWWFWCSSW